MTHTIRRVAFTAAAFASLLGVGSCVNGTTENGNDFYAVSTDIKDTSSYSAGAQVLVHAQVTFGGAPVGFANVTWAVTAGHGTISAAASTADSLGVATALWTLGDSVGTNTLAISSAGASDTLRLTGAIGTPSYLASVSADSTVVSVGGSVPLQVRVDDRPGNPVPGATVTWSTTGGVLSTASTVSDPSGLAAVSFTAGQAGTYFITANLTGKATRVFEVVVQ